MFEGRDSERPARVLIAGGGIAGLEALLAVTALAAERAEVTLAAPRPDFLYKPLLVEEPFSSEIAERRELAPIAEEFGARFVQRSIERFDPEARVAHLDGGSTLDYEFAVVCVGGISRPAIDGATTLDVSGDREAMADILTEIAPDATQRIAFVVPPRCAWPLPIYELALMTERRARELRLPNLELTLITPEPSPLIVFGTRASTAVAELLAARGIGLRTSTRASGDDFGVLELSPGGARVAFEHVIALPEIEGPRIGGLPADDGGFIPIDDRCRVKGVADVYAAGDGTNFPIKQGGLGTQQADAAAEDIAARLGAASEARPFDPVLRGMLLTGGESLKMAHSLTGGKGEGRASADYLWWPPHKVSGRYLAPYLAGETAHRDPDPPLVPLQVEVSLPHEWHEQPIGIDPLEGPPAER